jgi:hypothetical protein
MIWAAIALARTCAGLPTSDPTADAPNLLHIVDPIGLLFEQELV